jgi:hypothetical protein
MEHDQFLVDLKNLNDIRAKFADAQAILSKHKKELDRLREVEREYQDWSEIVEFLRARVPAEVEADRAHAAAPGHASEPPATPVSVLAAEVVNREMRKIRSREVCQILQDEGHDVTPNTVSNALYYATHKAKSIKTAAGRGMYAPLAFEEEPSFDPPENGQVPQARPEEPYSAPEEEAGAHPAGDSNGGVSGGPVNVSNGGLQPT